MPSRARFPLAHNAPDTAILLRRATFGANGHIEHVARDLGWNAFVEHQLDPTTIDDHELEQPLASEFPESALSAKDALDCFDAPARRTRAVTVLRAVHSKRQLFERVVEFWNDHFSIDLNAGECRILKGLEDRTAVRAHALGRFRDLLEAVTKSAAMLEYLDNRKNVKSAPNENFARELLELHTLGVGEYDETDVREVARCFTGWSIRPRQDRDFGAFTFDADQHDDGAKRVLGMHVRSHGGERDGHLVLDLLARHPATAQRIARKLCARFVTEEPSGATIDAVACAFIESDGDLRATMRAVLRPENFEARGAADLEGETVRPKFMRPFHLVVALLRATRANVTNANGLLDELVDLGDAPFSWPTPDGPPDVRAWWESSLLSRWRFVERFVRQEIEGVSFEAETLTAGSTADEIVNRLDASLMGDRMSASDRRVLLAHADALTPLDADARRRLLTLAACSPSFQVA